MTTTKKPKVLLLDNDLVHYRIPIYNILAERVDFTHACCYPKKIDDEMKFKSILLPPFNIGRFTFQKRSVYKFCQQFDAIISYGDMAYLQFITLPWHCRRKFKIAFWGIGVSASYTKHFDAVSRWDKFRKFFYKKADALVFYTDYPIKKYTDWGFKRESLFVAPNTVAVEEYDENQERKNLLFVGTLYREKGLQYLLDAYYEAFSIDPNIPNFDIIGAGPDSDIIKQWIASHKMEDKITMHGAIYDRKIKALFFARSIACISPMQAGLSVLESQGYGTTFVTTKTAFTGGEIFNIRNGETGILLDNVEQLKDTILDISKSPDKYLQIGKNARKHYLECRKPEDMAQGFCDVVDYMLKQK